MSTGRVASLPFCWILAAAIALAIYGSALDGPFISDDALFLVINPFTATLSPESLREMLDPWGEAQVSSYAPVHLLATALELQAFGDDPLGYHVVNVLIHALNATLLLALLVASRLPPAFALFGALFFLVHPANVEAVAWISQLKTNGSLAFALGAVLAFRRHPGIATALFVMGLLTKASAAAALPMAAALAWSMGGKSEEEGRAGGGAAPWLWLAAWLLLLLLFAIPQSTAIHPRGTTEVAAYQDFGVHVRTIASVGTHYLVMAYTGLGVAYAQEIPPVVSPLDAWWLAALPLAGFFVWRSAASLRRRSEEAIYWLGAAAGFAPVSQLLPFLHPIADRYLYFILPGLIGGTLLLLRQVLEARSASSIPGLGSPAVRGVAAASAIAVLIALGVQSAARAALWTDHTLLLTDSADHFPDGRNAYFLRARRAAAQGDAGASVALLRRAVELGGDQLQFDPAFQPIRQHPGFRALSRELAGRYIALVSSLERPLQRELSALAAAHLERGEYGEAERALEAAIRRGGIMKPQLEFELDWVRRLRAEIGRKPR